MLRRIAAFSAVVGLAVVVAMPAYAAAPADPNALAVGLGAASGPSGQGVEVASISAPAMAERDSLAGLPGQPTPEDLAAAYRLSGGTISWPLGDDYYLKDSANAYGMSPMGYGIRTCTDFVAWRLNRDAGSFGAPWLMPWAYLTPTGGEASSWADAWAANGWASSTTPVAGSVAWSGYGANHVAYVQAVHDDGTITIEEYNWNAIVYGTRTIAASSIPLFLYPPPTP